MPAFIYAWLLGLAPILAATFWQLLMAVGIGVASYTGISLAFDQLHDFVVGQYAGLPAATMQLMGLMRVDQAFNLIASAVIAKFTLRGLTGGTIKAFKVS